MGEVAGSLRVELVTAEIRTGAASQEAPPPAAIEAALKAMRQEIEATRLDFMDRLTANLNRHGQLNYDLKQYAREMEHYRKAFEFVIKRITAVEKALGIDPFKIDPEHPGSGHHRWTLTAEMNAAQKAAETKKRHKPALKLTGPDAAWKREAAQEAEKLRAELPPLVGIPDLMRRWGISYNYIVSIIGKQDISTIRQGTRILIPKESIIEYVKREGAPHPRIRHYGTRGIVPE